VSRFDLFRLRGPLIASAVVGLAILLLDMALQAALGTSPDWLAAAFSSEVLDQCGSRLARVEQLERAGQVSDQRLVAVVGLSPVREGIDPQMLAAADPEKRNWLVLGSQGRTFATLEVFVRALAESPVHPRLVVLGIVPAMLHHEDRAEPQDASPRLLLHHLRQHRYYHVALDASWLMRNRDSLADESSLLVYESQRLMRWVFGLPMSATYPPEKDPWTSWTEVYGEHSTAALTELQWQGHKTLLVPSQFRDVRRQSQALRNMVTELRRHGSDVVCVLMPETQRLRNLYPPIVGQKFGDAVAMARADGSLPVIDMRADIPDDMFFNDAHLNPRGRKRLSSELPALLP
jgi:hypothetical protein